MTLALHDATTSKAHSQQQADLGDIAEPANAARLGPLEWAVVAIARNDRLSSLRQPGRLALALASPFGMGRNPRLADPKLEALRRMAVLGWHHGFAVPVSEIRSFMAAGFTTDQFETMLTSISVTRADRKLRG